MVKNLETAEKAPKYFQGIVISAAMDKTITVKVSRTGKHACLQKIVQDFKKYKVHDEKEEASIGDLVEFYQGRPKSKTKYMYLHRVILRA